MIKDITYKQTFELQKALKDKGYVQHDCGLDNRSFYTRGKFVFVSFYKPNTNQMEYIRGADFGCLMFKISELKDISNEKQIDRLMTMKNDIQCDFDELKAYLKVIIQKKHKTYREKFEMNMLLSSNDIGEAHYNATRNLLKFYKEELRDSSVAIKRLDDKISKKLTILENTEENCINNINNDLNTKVIKFDDKEIRISNESFEAFKKQFTNN